MSSRRDALERERATLLGHVAETMWEEPMPEKASGKQKWTPGKWQILEVMGKRFVAAPAYEGHPYFGNTRFVDIASPDEEYPTMEGDLLLISKAPELVEALRELLAVVNNFVAMAKIEGAIPANVEAIAAEAQALLEEVERG